MVQNITVMHTDKERLLVAIRIIKNTTYLALTGELWGVFCGRDMAAICRECTVVWWMKTGGTPPAVGCYLSKAWNWWVSYGHARGYGLFNLPRDALQNRLHWFHRRCRNSGRFQYSERLPSSSKTTVIAFLRQLYMHTRNTSKPLIYCLVNVNSTVHSWRFWLNSSCVYIGMKYLHWQWWVLWSSIMPLYLYPYKR